MFVDMLVLPKLRSDAKYASLGGNSRDEQSPYSRREEVGQGQDCVGGKNELQKGSNGSITSADMQSATNRYLWRKN